MIGLIFLSLIVIFLFTLYLYLTRNFNYWKRKGIDFVPPIVGFGNIGPSLLLRKSLWEIIQEIHEQSQGPLTGIFLNDKPALVVRDLDLFKHIFSTDFDHFIDREFSPHPKSEPFIAHNLFGMKGQNWRNLRVKLTPTFTSGKMKNMFYLVHHCCEQFEKVLQDYSNTKKPFPTKDIMARYTVDVISTCAFGIDGKSLEDPDWIINRVMKKVGDPDLYTGLKFALMLVAPHFLSLFPIRVFPKDVYKTLTDVIMNNVVHRENNNIYRRDYLDTLIELRKQSMENPNSNFVMNDKILVAQSFMFFIAGFDTGSTTMTLALYELAFNQEIQNKLRGEISDVLKKHNGEMTYDSLKEMTYLHQVLYETLRKYPSLPFLDRLCVKDYKIPNSEIVIEKGTRVFMSMIAIQRDAANFDNPYEFQPERFSPDRVGSYHKYSFLPFGEGPRNCIGMKFGLMQTKAGLVQVLRNYSVEPTELTPKKPSWNSRNFALFINGELYLNLRRTNN